MISGSGACRSSKTWDFARENQGKLGISMRNDGIMMENDGK
jgi:hypothetical protein